MTTCPTCVTKLASAPARGLISIRHGTAEQNMYSGGSRGEFGGTGGARGHILWPTKVTQIDTGLVKKLSKTVKKGYPLFLPGFWEPAGTLDPPPLVWALGGRFCPGGSIPAGQKPHFGPQYRGGGSKVPARFPKSCFGEGGGPTLSPL